VSQPAEQATTPPVPPIIFPQSDLPPLSPEFQNLPETNAAAAPADQSPIQQVIVNTGSSAPPDISSVTPKTKKKFGGGKIIATILGLVVLVGGIAAGIILTQQKQLFKQKAAVSVPCAGGCGEAPDPVPSFNSPPTQVGPFTTAGNLIIYYVGLGSSGTRTVYITSHDGSHTVTMDTSDKTRIVTNIPINAGETITITDMQEPNQGDPACAPIPGPPYSAIGWMQVNTDTTCGTGLNGPPSDGQCVPMDKPSVASAISWAQSFGDPSMVGRQCWADWMEWPGDYDFNDFFLMFAVSAISAPTPTPPPLSCNSVCLLDSDCPVGMVCYLSGDSAPQSVCRNTLCRDDGDCICEIVAPTSTPTPTPPPPAPYCVAVTTYSTSWALIPESGRSSLTAGTTINFCVSGYRSTGIFDDARFTINGVMQTGEEIVKRPGSADLCQAYTIPSGTTSFTVKGEIHDSIYGWFGGISVD